MGVDAHPRYAALKHDGQLCAAASFWCVPNEPIPFEGQISIALWNPSAALAVADLSFSFLRNSGADPSIGLIAGRSFERDYPPRAWSEA